jgi:endonuclease-3
MKDPEIHQIIPILRETVKPWQTPAVTRVAQENNPFQILIATVLSLRTKDEVTAAASARLFALANNPHDMLKLTPEQIMEAIYPAGFYRRKAQNILDICRIVVDEYDGRVPADLDTLLELPGVGRKTANLVVTMGFGLPGICVDTHVHRITNRWGYVATKTPEQTEMVLREKLPREYWIEINDLLVGYGQNLCTPISPKCSLCPIRQFCDRAGVTKSR